MSRASTTDFGKVLERLSSLNLSLPTTPCCQCCAAQTSSVSLRKRPQAWLCDPCAGDPIWQRRSWKPYPGDDGPRARFARCLHSGGR